MLGQRGTPQSVRACVGLKVAWSHLPRTPPTHASSHSCQSFASEEALKEILNLIPGSVTPYGLLHDTDAQQVTFCLDAQAVAAHVEGSQGAADRLRPGFCDVDGKRQL